MTGIYKADPRLWAEGTSDTLDDPDRGLPTDGCSPRDKRQRRPKTEAGGQIGREDAAVPKGQSPPTLGCGDALKTRPREGVPGEDPPPHEDPLCEDTPPRGHAQVRTRPREDMPR